MKRKAINSVITKKINDWLSSIEDENLVKELQDNIIVTGGCITSMLLNEDINDFDVYFKNKQVVKAVAQYYARIFNRNNGNAKNKLGQSAKAWVLDGKDVEDWKLGKIKLSDFAYGYPDMEYSSFIEWEYKEIDNKEIVKEIVKEIEMKNDCCSRVSGMINNTPPERIKIIVNSDGIAENSDENADKEWRKIG